jgi:hypothetical protein
MKSSSWKWYVSHFPESMFLCSQQNIKTYTEYILKGKELAKKSNILICGITRNSAKILPYTIARIEKLGSYFNKYNVFMFENDSIDGTKKILEVWSQTNNNVKVKFDDFNPPPFTDPKGIVRRKYMAKARNEYIYYARHFITINPIDYIFIVDTDLNGGWSYYGIFNTLGQERWWDVVGSNSLYYGLQDSQWIKLFYDSWAFRPLDHPKSLEDQEANLFVFNRGEPLVAVNSCFGGLAIYKPYFLSEGISYTAEDCDHPTLHNELVNKGYQIFLNPSQITLYNKSQYII